MFDFILRVIEAGGYAGVALVMFAENVFPPIPSEIVLPLVGFSAANGTFNVVGAVAAASAGVLLGTLPWYFAGRFFTLERLKALSARYGRLMTLTPDDLDYAAAWFARHGKKAVLFGQLVPVIRTLISVPAGLTRMRLPLFLAYAAVGTTLWSALLIAAGYVLESQYERVAAYLNPLTSTVVIGIVILYLYRVATFGRKHPFKK